jgi:hypothetical protein
MPDEDLRLQILRVCVRDRQFLKSSYAEVDPEDFEELEERLILDCSLKFYDTYQEPIGPMLRSTVLAALEKNGDGVQQKKVDKKKLRLLMDSIQKQQLEPVSVQALQDRVKELHKNRFFQVALNEVLAAEQQGTLSVDLFAGLVEKAGKELKTGYQAIDFFDPEELEKRALRREAQQKVKRFPKIGIRRLERRIKIIGRGMLGMVIAPYGQGKSFLLLNIAAAYARQGLNVLYITLEDPKEEVEDRLDAALTGTKLSELVKLPTSVKEKLMEKVDLYAGRIKIVDGTMGGISISRVEQIWRQEKQEGFEADSVIIDYDDEIECEKQFKGESARRYEFAEIYRRMRRAAVNTDSIWWTASQTGRAAEGKKIVEGKDIAEDISKARKTFFALSIGVDPDDETKKWLNVVKHKMDRSRFQIAVYTDYENGLFYDYDRSETLEKKTVKVKAEA